MDQSTFTVLRLLETSGMGAQRVRKVLSWARSREGSLAQLLSSEKGRRQALTQKQIEGFKESKERAKKRWAELREAGIQIVSLLDEAYPPRLRENLGSVAPPLLTLQGNPELLQLPSVGFCGSRKASDRGLKAARDCADQLAGLGINVISGYAAGVDMATHRTALKSDGVTTVVLPSGILHFKIKQAIEDVWDWSRVAVVSEFPPGVPWSGHNAMQRNATIAGLAGAMVLIEASKSGGSIDAGRKTLKMGLPLFAAVYRDMPEHSKGNMELLEQGAVPLKRSRKTGRANLMALLEAIGVERDQDGSAPGGTVDESGQTDLFPA